MILNHLKTSGGDIMNKIIFTGNYDNCKIGNTISISGDRGKSVNYNGKYLSFLAPKLSFWKIWKDNIGKISEEENTRFYIKEFYNNVLKKLDPEEVLMNIPDRSILLCFEDNNKFCHRHLVAFWLELFMGIKTYEIKTDEKTNKAIILDRPEYLKVELEKIIKENYNMVGFNSIRAAYLFHQADELERIFEKEAEVWMKLCGSIPSKGSSPCEIMMDAANLRIEADNEEEKYVKQMKLKNIPK